MENQSEIRQNLMAADSDEMEIDLGEIFFYLLDRWKLILLALLLGAVAAGAYCTFLKSPTYEAYTSTYIVESDGSDLTTSDVQLSAYLSEDYVEIAESYSVLSAVISDLNLTEEEDITYNSLLEIIDVTVPDDTHLVTITATTSDPELSRDIANAVTEASILKFHELVGSEMASVLDYSTIDNVDMVQPGLMKYLVIGAFLGAVLACVVLLIRMLTDTTIKTEDDVQKHLGIPVLASVPYFQ